MTERFQRRVAAISGGLLAVALATHLLEQPMLRDIALVVASLAAGGPIAVKAWQALRHKAFSIDLLVTIAVTGALVIGEYVESAVVAFLFVFGGWLEARTLERTRSSLRRLVERAPQEALVVRGNETITVDVDDVVVGDRVVVHSGGKVPVDGVITGGRALVDEATITGEPVHVPRTVGDRLFGGTILDTGYVELTAEAVGEDTTFARIIQLVEEAQESKTTAQKFLDRFARVYTPAIVVLAVLVYLATRDVRFALTFLVIACPGALVISTPVSMVAGLGNGARHGVLVKGGDAMERLAKVDTVVFDKTGTLTEGKPTLTGIRSVGDLTDEQLLVLAARLELASEHPLGRTVVTAAQDRGLLGEDATPATGVDVVKGGGIRGWVDGHAVAVGSRRLLQQVGAALPESVQDDAVARERDGHTVVFVAVDGRLGGLLAIADRVRPEAAEAIDALRRSGVRETVMLTGDNRHSAERVAGLLGIDVVHAELLPQDKVERVQTLTASGRTVAMIGDGVNDAPAIAAADIGIAMGGGTDVSIETADVILMANRFDQLVHAYGLSRATVRNMVQNTALALAVVAALLAGVLTRTVFMSGGMLIHEVSVLVVVLNAVRLLRYRDPTTGRSPGEAEQVAEHHGDGPRDQIGGDVGHGQQAGTVLGQPDRLVPER